MTFGDPADCFNVLSVVYEVNAVRHSRPQWRRDDEIPFCFGSFDQKVCHPYFQNDSAFWCKRYYTGNLGIKNFSLSSAFPWSAIRVGA